MSELGFVVGKCWQIGRRESVDCHRTVFVPTAIKQSDECHNRIWHRSPEHAGVIRVLECSERDSERHVSTEGGGDCGSLGVDVV